MKQKDYKLGWKELSFNSFDPKTVRKLQDEHEYQFHKELAKEMIGSIEKYAEVYYVDPFSPYIIHKNRYSYRVKDGIRHYILWCSPKSYISCMTARKIAQTRFPGCNLIVRQNKPSLRTIKTIKHYHIFVQLRDK